MEVPSYSILFFLIVLQCWIKTLMLHTFNFICTFHRLSEKIELEEAILSNKETGIEVKEAYPSFND